MIRFILAALIVMGATISAEARRSQPVSPMCIPTSDIMRPCAYNPNFLYGVKSISVHMHRVKSSAKETRPHVRVVRQRSLASRVARAVSEPVRRVAEYATRMLPHPDGCPRHLFCGCGAAAELGLHDRSLWLAENWLKFPRSAPAPGTAAARPGHVFVLKQHIDGDVWLVADYNSGGGQSRLHARSIRGYTIVSPHT